MTDYIPREAVLEFVEPDARPFLAERIKSITAADVRPVVKAKWEWNDNNGYYYCGNCKAVSPREDQDGEYIDCPNFCPNCGAWMGEKAEEGE